MSKQSPWPLLLFPPESLSILPSLFPHPKLFPMKAKLYSQQASQSICCGESSTEMLLPLASYTLPIPLCKLRLKCLKEIETPPELAR